MFNAAGTLLVAALVAVAAAPALAADVPSPQSKPKSATLRCERGKMTVRVGDSISCLRVPRNAAMNQPKRGLAKAAWYDNYGNWHNSGNLVRIRRWPYTGWYTSGGRSYYFWEYRETWWGNMVTLYGYWFWNGRDWQFWGDYQCTGMNILPSDTCTWFAAR
jgi:hypothetical protein